jgi:nucleoside-diphosphate-sugar epimerase
MGQILIIGGSGFMGRTLQDEVVRLGRASDFVFGYAQHPKRIRSELASRAIDLLDPDAASACQDHSRIIWVAGSSDHGLGWDDPEEDLRRSVLPLLRMLRAFRGDLTMLSSQAVYFGLEGRVPETIDHTPGMPYGLGKLSAERYARWALEAGRLRTLWCYRLMYAFGVHDKPRRLLKRCAAAAHGGSPLTVTGGGVSFVNPLPADFVVRALLAAHETQCSEGNGFEQCVNLNHPECWTVLDVVKQLRAVRDFEVVLKSDGERYPVRFWGDTERLRAWLSRWSLDLPGVTESLVQHHRLALESTDPTNMEIES